MIANNSMGGRGNEHPSGFGGGSGLGGADNISWPSQAGKDSTQKPPIVR